MRRTKHSPRSPGRLTRALAIPVALALFIAGYGCGGEGPVSVETSTKDSADQAAAPAKAPSEISSTDSPSSPGTPKLKFVELTHDFGDVDDTEDLHHDFEFTNTGDGLLVINEIKASCGCTTTKLEKMEYQPGESGAIELKFHPKGYGAQTKTITVKSDSADNPRIVLFIKSKVTPFVQFDPRSVRFNQVPSSEGREQEVKVICRDANAIFGGPVCTHTSFEAAWTSPPENGRGTLLVKLKPGAAKGNAINRVKLDVQGVTKAGAASARHTAELSVSAAVFGEIIIDPVFLSVGRVNPGGRVDKSVELRRPNGQAFKILSSEITNASPANLEVSVTPKGNSWTVRVQGDSGTYQGLVRGSVVITTDVSGDPNLRIPVMGAVRPDPKK